MQLPRIEDGFEIGQLPLHQPVADLGHRHALGLDGPRSVVGFRVVRQTGLGAPAKLLGSECGDVHEQEPAFDWLPRAREELRAPRRSASRPAWISNSDITSHSITGFPSRVPDGSPVVPKVPSRGSFTGPSRGSFTGFLHGVPGAKAAKRTRSAREPLFFSRVSPGGRRCPETRRPGSSAALREWRTSTRRPGNRAPQQPRGQRRRR